MKRFVWFSLNFLGVLSSCDYLRSTERESRDPAIEIQALSQITDETQRELRALQLLAAYPQESTNLCRFITSPAGNQQCVQYANRPHLWSVSSTETWKEGFFFSRLYFPSTETFSVVSEAGICGTDARCILADALQKAKDGDEGTSQRRCAALATNEAKWECFFQSSEVLQPVSYDKAVVFCLQAGSFAPECHNHLVLRLVQDGWISSEKHNLYRSQIETYWKSSSYAYMLLDVYWSALASRVLGVIQPFSIEDIPTSETDFIPHLHSALALRAVFSSQPLDTLQKALRETIDLPKAHGPNSPVFQPKVVWQADSEHQWIHFCDLRGGIRPVSLIPAEDQKLAIMTAAMMTIPPKKHLVEMFASDSSPLVRWASRQLLLQ